MPYRLSLSSLIFLGLFIPGITQAQMRVSDEMLTALPPATQSVGDVCCKSDRNGLPDMSLPIVSVDDGGP